MVDRRRFLSSGVALGAAAAFNRQLFAKVDAAPRNLPSSALYSSDEDSYWAEIRKQFLIPEDEVFLNNATVGSSPAPVLRAVFDAYNEIEKLAPEDPEDYPMWGYGSRPFNQFRDPMAAFVGCSRDEIALVRSATEGINYFANGVDMKPGDEVLITDQEHEHGEQPWQLKARRYGIAVKKVRLPKPAEDAAQVDVTLERRLDRIERYPPRGGDVGDAGGDAACERVQNRGDIGELADLPFYLVPAILE